MSMSLTRVTGTLLYSIDSNGNQMIVSLNDVTEPTLEIEFSKQHFYVSLPKLCGCKRCRFEKITLRIQMKDLMYLQCNEEITKDYTYERSKKFNKNYPIPKFTKTNKLEARLWLVNTPYFEDLYPNNAQLYGCIFEVWYNNKIIKMESLGVGDKCTKTCIPGICNSGECLETYNHSPVCNCTSSFYNGRICNDSVKDQNYEVSHLLTFTALKLSFNNVYQNFFQLMNERVSLRLSTMGTNLVFILNDTNYLITIKAVLYQKYHKEENYIIIMEFEQKFVNIKFLVNESSWILTRFPYYIDLGNEIFNKLILQNGEGIIEMVYKNDLKETKWHKPSFNKEKVKTIEDMVAGNLSTTEDIKKNDSVTNINKANSRQYILKDQVLLIEDLNRKVVYFFGALVFLMLIIILMFIPIYKNIIIHPRKWCLIHFRLPLHDSYKGLTKEVC